MTVNADKNQILSYTKDKAVSALSLFMQKRLGTTVVDKMTQGLSFWFLEV